MNDIHLCYQSRCFLVVHPINLRIPLATNLTKHWYIPHSTTTFSWASPSLWFCSIGDQAYLSPLEDPKCTSLSGSSQSSKNTSIFPSLLSWTLESFYFLTVISGHSYAININYDNGKFSYIWVFDEECMISLALSKLHVIHGFCKSFKPYLGRLFKAIKLLS